MVKNNKNWPSVFKKIYIRKDFMALGSNRKICWSEVRTKLNHPDLAYRPGHINLP
jgi:hypothetical protein